MPGLVREAAERALEDAELQLEGHRRRRDREGARHVRGRDDARAVPGRRARRRLQADAARAHRRQRRRLDRHRRGEPGAGGRPRARAHAWRSRSSRESNAMWALSIALPFSVAIVAGAGGYFAPLVRGYIRRSGAPEDTGIRVALKDRQNALKNPLRAPPAPGHQLREDRELADALGPDPLPRDVPVVGRRLRDGARERDASRARAAQARPGSTPPRCAASRPCSRAATR